MGVKIEWKGDEARARIDEGLRKGIIAAGFALQAAIQAKLSRLGRFASFARQATADDWDFIAREGFVDPPGGSPRLRSGRLRRTIQSVDASDASGPAVEVGVHGGLEYAAIHEFGGPMPGGRPYIVIDDGAGPEAVFISESTAARLQGAGRKVFRTKPYNMPARPFIRPALAENESRLIRTIEDAVARELDGMQGLPEQ